MSKLMKLPMLFAVLFIALPVSGRNHFGLHRSKDMDCKGTVNGVVFGQDGKPWGGIDLILEPAVGDYDFVLSTTKTDQHGRYRFLDVSCGSWGASIEDKKAGYPQSGRFMDWFLYGSKSPQVKITEKHLDAEFNVNAPPRPGILVVHLTNSKTRAKISRIELEFKVTRKQWERVSCEDSESSTCGDDSFLVPPDQNVKLHVTSKGFHEWNESIGHGKLIHLFAGEVTTIDAELDPIQN